MTTATRRRTAERFADFASALSAAATPEEVVGLVVEEGPWVCGASAVVLACQNFRLELEVLGATPTADLLEGHMPCSLDDRQPLADAARSGEPVWLSSAADRDRRYPHLTGARTEAFCALPLRTAGGILGALGLGFSEPSDFGDELKASITELADVCAASLHRARLYDSEHRLRQRAEFAAERLGRLQTLTAGLAAARGPTDVAKVVVSHGVIELGAADGTLFVPSASGMWLEPLATAGGSEPEHLPIDAELAAARCARTRDLVFEKGADGETVVAVPFVIKDSVAGVLVLSFAAERELENEELLFVRALGFQCAQALDRARLYEQRSTEARLLQRSLLPPHTPSIPGVEIATRYRPFGDGSVVGGDFYDVFQLPGERWGVVIGDVSGKGVAAATLTAMARYTIRTAALHEDSPAGVLRLLNDAILHDELEDRYCTAVLAELRPGPHGTAMRLASGGHPASLVRSGNEVIRLRAEGSAIGLLPGPHFAEVEHLLRPGDALVLYTDGVTEARSPGGELAGDLIEHVLAAADGSSAEDLASAIDDAIQRFQGGNMRDDMALVVARVTTTGRETG